LIAPQAGFAKEEAKVVGTWRLVSYEVEIQASGQKEPVMGEKPTGYLAFTPEGRIFFVLTGEARKAAKTDRERAELLSTLVAGT
jgi:Lipocalin-like domain